MMETTPSDATVAVSAASVPPPVVKPYEQRLQVERAWAMDEGHRSFNRDSLTHHSLRRIARRLNELQVPYAVAGGMALFHHGYQRFTSDVDILVTREGLETIHARLSGLGYLPPFSQSKHLRDTESGVKIEFLITGDFPGDGKPKPIAFPDPASVSVEEEGIRFLSLPTLIELKLASGMTNAARGKDLVDVQELIQTLALPLDFSVQLHPFVRGRFIDIWSVVHAVQRRYLLQLPTHDATAELLAAMQADGIAIDSQRSGDTNAVVLATDDAALAAKYGMVPEEDFWPDNSGRAGG